MKIDNDKIDEAVLGLLYLTLHDERAAWKGIDWDALDRLYRKGFIGDPATKAKRVIFSEEGLLKAKAEFERQFTKPTTSSWGSLPDHKGTKVCPAEGTTGFICKSAVDGKAFFRVYESDGTFVDYRLVHDDLEVLITKEAQASFYRRVDDDVLDHRPEVLGLNVTPKGQK